MARVIVVALTVICERAREKRANVWRPPSYFEGFEKSHDYREFRRAFC